MRGPEPTTTKDGVPVLFHEPHVQSGFRPINQPWSNYLLSLFQLHNEMMNTWTHLLALVIVLVRGACWWTEFPLLSDPYMWPLAVGVVTMVLLYTCSTCAHCFQNRSELVHYTCFMVDYAGIGLYGFGSTMLHYWYCLHEDFLGSLSHQLAIPVGAVLGVIVCICCSISKTRYKRPYPFVRRVWQMGSVLSIYIWLIFPIWYRIWMYVHDGKWESSFNDHLKQMIWFTIGGFFFGSDVPQRFCPGLFDIVGHSHQLFHVCIMFTTLKQMDALYLEITDDSAVMHSMEAPTFLNTWGVLAFVMLANAVVVTLFHFSVRRRLALEAQAKQMDKAQELVSPEPKLASALEKKSSAISKNETNWSQGSDIRQRQVANSLPKKELNENSPVKKGMPETHRAGFDFSGGYSDGDHNLNKLKGLGLSNGLSPQNSVEARSSWEESPQMSITSEMSSSLINDSTSTSMNNGKIDF